MMLPEHLHSSETACRQKYDRGGGHCFHPEIYKGISKTPVILEVILFSYFKNYAV